jgi:hypothetical protein
LFFSNHACQGGTSASVCMVWPGSRFTTPVIRSGPWQARLCATSLSLGA